MAADRTRRAAVLVSLALALLGLTALIVVGPLLERTAGPGPQATPTPTPTGPADRPPAGEVAVIHDALHDIDARCRAVRRGDPQPQLLADAEAIVRFARLILSIESGPTLTGKSGPSWSRPRCR